MSHTTVRNVLYVTLTSLGAVTVVFGTACASIGLTMFLQAVLAAIIRVIATLGEITIATISAISTGTTISITVILAAGTSAITFPPSHIEARLLVTVVVATASVVSSALALFTLTSFNLELELAVGVVTSAAASVAMASGWAVGVMSLIERETRQVGLKMTSLLQAVRNNQYNVLNILVYLPFGSQKDEMDTALMYAVKADFGDCVRVLVNAGADPNIQDAYENTPLIVVCQRGSINSARKLLDAGAEVNFRNGNGETALHHAAKWGHENCARLLLEVGADVNIQDTLGRSPLILVVKHARTPLPLIQACLGAGAEVDAVSNDHRTALHYAAIRGVQLQPFLAADAGLNIQDVEGNTPIHLASANGHHITLKELLDDGAEVNRLSYSLKNAMHFAASHGFVTCIELLLAHGCDPLKEDNAGHCPLSHAVIYNKPHVIKFFLRRKCFPPTASSYISPIRVALQHNFFHLAKMLVLAGCDASPLREPNLMVERRFWHDDSQMFNFVWLLQAIQQPQSLLVACRTKIRSKLQAPIKDICKLPLPTQLQAFLDLEDLDEFLDDPEAEETLSSHNSIVNNEIMMA